MENLEFIELNPKKDLQDLIDVYEKETDSKLSNAQDSRILINLIAYYGALVKNQVNDAANLNLVEKSRYPILDFLGRYKKCPRLKESVGVDRLKVKLKQALEKDFKISSGLEVATQDGLNAFKTLEDIVISAGDLEAIVKIESIEAGSKVNDCTKGTINTLVVSSYDNIIESVENLDGVTGGSDEEDDKNYIERILLSPEGFSVAGPEAAYIYFSKSAHSSILDVAVDVPKEDIKINLNGVETTIKSSSEENENFNITLDNIEEELTLILKKPLSVGDVLRVRIPHPYKIIPYILTKAGSAATSVLDKVKETLEPVKPLADYVVPKSANIVNYTIAGTIYLEKEADEEVTKKEVFKALEEFLEDKFKKSVVKHRIIKTVLGVDGVYDFKPDSTLCNFEEIKGTWYKGSIGELEFERIK